MTFRYLPQTEKDKKEMLAEIGVDSIDELFSDIPERIRLNRKLRLKPPASEPLLLKELSVLSEKNINMKSAVSFLGAGAYDHYIPSIVDHILSRGEFYTAYTPYQPEISQGELQAMFEFQTMICELTGMDVANSSMYDGGTALAEACLLAVNSTKRNKILISRLIHPEYKEVVRTYARGRRLEIIEIPSKNGVTDISALEDMMDESVAAVCVQYPNFFGRIEPLDVIGPIVHGKKGLFIVSANPLALGILTPPGSFGADLVTGDVQPLGIPPSFGGPHCGYFAARQSFLRKMPGRLVGETTDEEGRRGFVLTLQAREQHIRREKATSNICSNQALAALAAAVTMTALGKRGIREMALLNMQKAAYAKDRFREKGFAVPFDGPCFNEFVIQLEHPVREISKKLLEKGFIPGLDLGKTDQDLAGHMLVCVTELRTKDEIDAFVEEMGDLDGKHERFSFNF
jgi:glycine dehydrogenase (decarboxylating) alpha subunit (EC 1.4.4.2)